MVIGPGTYRETVSCGITFTAGTTTYLADLSGNESDGIGGPVIITNFTTNDTTAASGTSTLNLNGKSFMTFNDLTIIAGNQRAIVATSSNSHDINLNRLFLYCMNNQTLSVFTVANVAQNWVVDSCIIVSGTNGNVAVGLTLTRPATADFDYSIVFKSCFILGKGSDGINVASTGANAFKGGGVQIRGCTICSPAACVKTADANMSTTVPGIVVYNCRLMAFGGTGLSANTSGQITENYNVIEASTPRTNVTAGGNSQTLGSSYFVGEEWGQSWIQHFAPRPFLSPIENSNLLNFGFQTGNPTTDALGAPRSQNTSGAMMAAGAFELVNAASSATSPIDTGSNSLKIAGFGYEDFDLPVSAGAQVITVKAQFDGSYGGSTYPQFVIIDDTGATVNTTNFTVSASGAWESQTSPSFNPSAAKMYRLRLIAQSTAVAGNTYFDSVITMSQPGTVGFEVLLKGKPFGTLMPSSLAARGIRVGGRL